MSGDRCSTGWASDSLNSTLPEFNSATVTR